MRVWGYAIAAAALAMIAGTANSAVLFEFSSRDVAGKLISSFQYVSAEKVGHFASYDPGNHSTSCYLASGNPCKFFYAEFDSGAPGIAIYGGPRPGDINYGNPSAVSELEYFAFAGSEQNAGPFYNPANGVVYSFGTFTGYDTIQRLTGTLKISQAAVPEPAGWAIMLSGFAAIGAFLRRRRPNYGNLVTGVNERPAC